MGGRSLLWPGLSAVLSGGLAAGTGQGLGIGSPLGGQPGYGTSGLSPRRIAPHCVSWEKFLLLRLFGAVPMGSGEMQTSDTRSRAARLVLPYVVRFNDWNALA